MSRNSMVRYLGVQAFETPGNTNATLAGLQHPMPRWTRYNDYFLTQKGYDTTAIAVAIDILHLGHYSCTLISNRHVLLAGHVVPSADASRITSPAADTTEAAEWLAPSPGHLFGTPAAVGPLYVYFVNNSNVTFRYEITGVRAVRDRFPGDDDRGDISIGYLDRTIDTTLRFLKVVPANFLNYLQTNFIKTLDDSNEVEQLTSLSISPVLPVLYNTAGWYPSIPGGGTYGSTDLMHRTWCGALNQVDLAPRQSLTPAPLPGLWYIHPIAGAKFSNSQFLIQGDSGSAVFIPITNVINNVINNEIVLLGTWWGGGQTLSTQVVVAGQSIGLTTFLAPYITQINSAMTTLAGGTSYSLTQANLSGFKTF